MNIELVIGEYFAAGKHGGGLHIFEKGKDRAYCKAALIQCDPAGYYTAPAEAVCTFCRMEGHYTLPNVTYWAEQGILWAIRQLEVQAGRYARGENAPAAYVALDNVKRLKRALSEVKNGN